MNCRSATPLLSAERDSALGEPERTELDRHLAECPACRQLRAEIAEAMALWRSDAANVPVPDPEQEWHLLRAQLHAPERKAIARRSAAPLAWFGVPLAAAALALAFFVGRTPPRVGNTPAAGSDIFARADFVELADANSTPLVYLDSESGWLVVWAVEADANGRG